MIKIKINEFLDSYHYEIIEDELKRLFEELGVSAIIKDEITGNNIMIKQE